MMQLVLLFSSLLSPLIVVNAFIVAPSFVQHHHHHQKQHPPHLMTKGRHQYRHQPLQVATTATTTATTLPDGLVKTISTPGTGPLVRRGDVASVKYTCSVLDTNNNTTSTSPPFAKSTFQKVIVADSNMIDGWEMAICTMKVGERALITIPSTLAYGEMGVAPFISPHATILLDLEILDSNPPVQLDFDALGYAEPNTPRTASAIANAYDIRRQQMVPEREGLDGWLDKVRNYYFFGFFEGETGEQAPWFLRPSITFPIAFVIVGGTFYVSYAFGGIKERGAQVTDELDEIILSGIFGTTGTSMDQGGRAILTMAMTMMGMLLNDGTMPGGML